jgi:hypothetical protein
MDIVQAILHRYPNASPITDFHVRDDSDGRGAYLDVWNLPDPRPTDEDLQQWWNEVELPLAKQAKIAELRQALTNSIATFQSSALGTPHTYLADEKSMTLLAAEYSYVTSPAYDGQPTPWYTKEEGRVLHTGEQIQQLFIDGRAHVKTQYAHYDDLVAQAKSANNIDQINSISW